MKGRNLKRLDFFAVGLRAAMVGALAAMACTTAFAQQTPSVDPRTAQSGEQSGQQAQQSQQGQRNSATGEQSAQPQSSLVGPRTVVDTTRQTASTDQLTSSLLLKPPAAPGEFETYIERLLGRKLQRYGADLILPSSRDFAQPATASVPPSYVVRPGDTIVISLSGSMDGSVRRKVDNTGKIFLEGVGAIRVAGVRHADLRDTLAAAIGSQYRGFTVSVALESLRGIRVYVTGFANNPGAFTVSSLSTMANALFQAGGPTSGGSFRSIKLYRNGHEVGDFDLYQLLRGGNRVKDLVLENEDVLFVPPAGPQVAVIGSVQEEAIYEAQAGESVEQMLLAAGGPNTLGDSNRIILYRSHDNDRPGPRELSRPEARATRVEAGDIIQLLSTGSLIQPLERQSVLVRIEGEVQHPGIYYVAPNTSLDTIVGQAGGITSRAFVYGTKLTRQSVKQQQREGYRDAVQQLELSLAAAPIVNDTSVSSADRQAQIAGARAVLDRLKQTEPDGRVVLPIAYADASLPGATMMEDGDVIFIPARPSTVGVFGAVYRPASFMLGGGRPAKVKDYVELAGGTLRSADRGGIFVVRANGEVLSRKRGALNAVVYPGDVIFIPVKTQGNTFWAKFKDITQTLFQLGLATATVFSVAK